MHTLYILRRVVSSEHRIFQTALGPMHPDNNDGIDV